MDRLSDSVDMVVTVFGRSFHIRDAASRNARLLTDDSLTDGMVEQSALVTIVDERPKVTWCLVD